MGARSAREFDDIAASWTGITLAHCQRLASEAAKAHRPGVIVLAIGANSVVLLAPPEAACAGLTVAFQWRIDTRQARVTYCAEIWTDKGVNPFDGGVAERFQAGQMTQLEVMLSPTRYDPRQVCMGSQSNGV